MCRVYIFILGMNIVNNTLTGYDACRRMGKVSHFQTCSFILIPPDTFMCICKFIVPM